MCGRSHVSICLLSCDVDQNAEMLTAGPRDRSLLHKFLGILWFFSGNESNILLEITTKVTSLHLVWEVTALRLLLCADFNCTALLTCRCMIKRCMTPHCIFYSGVFMSCTKLCKTCKNTEAEKKKNLYLTLSFGMLHACMFWKKIGLFTKH